MAASFFIMFFAITMPNISAFIISNILKSTNTGGGIKVELNHKNEKPKSYEAELVTDKGIYVKDDEGQIIFLDASTYTAIKYLKNNK